MKKQFVLGGLVCLAMGATSTTMAGIIVVSTQSFTYTGGTTPYSQTITVNKFNGTFGTGYGQITGLNFVFNATLSGSITASLAAGYPAENVDYLNQNGILSVKSGSTTLASVLKNIDVANSTANWNNSGGTTELTTLGPTTTSGVSQTFSGITDSINMTSSSSSSPIVNLLLGTGTLSLSLKGTSTTAGSFDTDISLASSDSVVAGGSFQIQFLEEVPEPNTWIAAGLLFGVVGIHSGRSFWRKRSQVAA